MKRRKVGISAMAGTLAAILLLSFFAFPSKAASSGEIREQINDLEDQQEEIQAQIEALEQQKIDNLSQMEEIVVQKTLLDQQVFLLYEQIANVDEQITAYRVLIADKQDELDEAETEYDALREQYRERVRAMEEEGTLSYWSVLFKASSFADFLDRLYMIEEIAASDQRRLQELNDAAQKVAEAQAELEAGKDALEDTKAELDISQETLNRKRAESDQLLNDLVAKGQEFEIYMEAAEDEQSRIMFEIAAQEAAYDAAVEREYWATYVPTTTAPATAVPTTTVPAHSSENDNSGNEDSGESQEDTSPSSNAEWLTPVPYYILTSPFGMRIHPLEGVWKMHWGVDLACAMDTPIYASRSGTILQAGNDESMGVYVLIDHGDGYRSIYMHMTHYIVSIGEYVSAGQTIGYVGSTGASNGPHLHFGIYDVSQGCYVNPMDFLS